MVYLLRTNSTLLFSMIALLRFIDLHIFMFTWPLYARHLYKYTISIIHVLIVLSVFCFFAIYTYIHADFTALRQIMSFKHYDPFTIIHNPEFALNTLNTVKYNKEINNRERKMGTNFQTKYIFFPNRVIQLHVSLKYVQPNAQYRLWGATIWIQSSLNTSVGFLQPSHSNRI